MYASTDLQMPGSDNINTVHIPKFTATKCSSIKAFTSISTVSWILPTELNHLATQNSCTKIPCLFPLPSTFGATACNAYFRPQNYTAEIFICVNTFLVERRIMLKQLLILSLIVSKIHDTPIVTWL